MIVKHIDPAVLKADRGQPNVGFPGDEHGLHTASVAEKADPSLVDDIIACQIDGLVEELLQMGEDELSLASAKVRHWRDKIIETAGLYNPRREH